MAKVWKEIISPGEYYYTAPDGKGAVMTATSGDIRYWHDQGKAMLKDELSIPIPLEHDTDCIPMSLADKAAKQLKNNTGWVEDFAIRDNDRLFGLCNVLDEEVAKKLPSTIKFTSPWFHSFQAGNGKKWDGVITHLALTSRPRVMKQEPFKDVAAALSLLPKQPTLRGTMPTDGVLLSRAGAIKADGKPLFEGAFSIWSGVKLADVPKAKDDPRTDPKGKDKMHVKDGKVDKPPDKTDEGDKKPVDTDGDAYEDDMDPVCILCDLLSIYDIEMGEDCTEENLPQRLMAAVTAKLKNDMGAGDMTKPNDPAKPPAVGNPAPAPTIQEAPPMYMSLEEVEKITDPRMKLTAKMALSLQTRALDGARKERESRIKELRQSRKINDKQRDMLLERAKSAKLSLSDDGSVSHELDAELALLAAGDEPIHVPSLLKPGESFLEQPHPEEYNGGGISDQRAEEIANRLTKQPVSPVTSTR